MFWNNRSMAVWIFYVKTNFRTKIDSDGSLQAWNISWCQANHEIKNSTLEQWRCLKSNPHFVRHPHVETLGLYWSQNEGGRRWSGTLAKRWIATELWVVKRAYDGNFQKKPTSRRKSSNVPLQGSSQHPGLSYKPSHGLWNHLMTWGSWRGQTSITLARTVWWFPYSGTAKDINGWCEKTAWFHSSKLGKNVEDVIIFKGNQFVWPAFLYRLPPLELQSWISFEPAILTFSYSGTART